MAQTLTIGITGADGLLGVHLRAYLLGRPDIVVKTAGRRTFETNGLTDFVRGCDAVIHLAGMNRGSDHDLVETNLSLTRRLIAALSAAESATHVLFSSSTHVERDTAYGRSKREAAALLAAWAKTSGGQFTNLILPGVFGEGGRPHYNSVVATFCAQLAQGEQPTLHTDASTEQVHAQDVARQCEQLIRESSAGEVRIAGQVLTLPALLDTLTQMRAEYQQQIIPDLRQDFRRDLFNTYRSYLYPRHYPVALTLHQDARGQLFEAVKSPNGGQMFMSTTHPGVTRGNHYHTRKVERFLVTAGQADIKLRHIFSDQVQTFTVSGDQPAFIDIPTLHTHNITNVGQDTLTTLFWTHELFDPARPDTVPATVELT
jgi:UDP-2-acetamido-2,6-beta-L-arabino-hexul-4-ose reductase